MKLSKKIVEIIFMLSLLSVMITTTYHFSNKSTVLEQCYLDASNQILASSQPLSQFILDDCKDISSILSEGNLNFMVFTPNKGFVYLDEQLKIEEDDTVVQIFLLRSNIDGYSCLNVGYRNGSITKIMVNQKDCVLNFNKIRTL